MAVMASATGVMIVTAAGKSGSITAPATIAAMVVAMTIAVVSVVVAGVIGTGAPRMVMGATGRKTQNRKQSK